jgi:hypothetical protein
VAADPSPDLVLTPLEGKARTVRQLVTTFHLLFVALDPFEEPSTWILESAVRILKTFEQADVRVALVITAGPADARLWLGPHAQELLVFTDPDRSVVKGFGLEYLPAIVHVSMDGTLMGSAEHWHPNEWFKVTENLARITAWKGPIVPGPKDPGPFEGTPAQG